MRRAKASGALVCVPSWAMYAPRLRLERSPVGGSATMARNELSPSTVAVPRTLWFQAAMIVTTFPTDPRGANPVTRALPAQAYTSAIESVRGLVQASHNPLTLPLPFEPVLAPETELLPEPLLPKPL